MKAYLIEINEFFCHNMTVKHVVATSQIEAEVYALSIVASHINVKHCKRQLEDRLPVIDRDCVKMVRVNCLCGDTPHISLSIEIYNYEMLKESAATKSDKESLLASIKTLQNN